MSAWGYPTPASAIGQFDDASVIPFEKGLDRNGRYRYLYDSARFFDREELRDRFNERNQGSLVLQLKEEEHGGAI